MRTIKFRAWDKENKIMYSSQDYSFAFLWDTFGVWNKEIGVSECFGGQKELNLMQFTGLLDKNGKEIYCGDLLKIEGSSRRKKIEEVGEVAWYDKHARWGIRLKDGMTAFYPFGKEIIGNIYENPDLLSNN